MKHTIFIPTPVSEKPEKSDIYYVYAELESGGIRLSVSHYDNYFGWKINAVTYWLKPYEVQDSLTDEETNKFAQYIVGVLGWKDDGTAEANDIKRAVKLTTKHVSDFYEAKLAACKSEWVSVGDCMPERGVRVEVYDEIAGIQIAHLSLRGLWLRSADGELLNNVTHWQPLPPLPEQTDSTNHKTKTK